MTIEEAQQLVEVWNAKHPVERCTCGNEGDGSPVRATAATPCQPGHIPRRDAGTRAGYGCRTGTDRPPRPTGRRSTGPPFLGTARRGEPAAGGPDRRADRNARPAQHRTRTITAVPDTPGHTPVHSEHVCSCGLSGPQLRRRAHRQPEHAPGCARSARPRATQKSTTTDYDTPTRHVDTTSRYDETEPQTTLFRTRRTDFRFPDGPRGRARRRRVAARPERQKVDRPDLGRLGQQRRPQQPGGRRSGLLAGARLPAPDGLRRGDPVASGSLCRPHRRTAAAPTAIGLLRQFGQRSGRRGAQAGQTLHGPHRTGLV